MPWSGGVYTRTNGVYTGATTWAQTQSGGFGILSSQEDTHDQDIATGLNNCMTIDGLNKAAANITPSLDATYSLGGSSARWQNLYVSAGALFYNGSTNAVTLAAGTLTAARSVTFGDFAGTVVIDTATQTLTNKTLTAPVIATIVNTGTLTLPTSTDTLVGRATTDTLTNKTLTSPTINGASFSGSVTGIVASIADATNGGLVFSASTGAVTANLDASFLRGFIDGFETGAPGGAATLTIGPGACVDNTNANLMKVTSTYTKTMGSWAVGSGNGGLDTGSVAATTAYFVYVIQRTDTGVTDYLISTSSSSPTLPSSYTVTRGPVAWFKTDGSSHIWQFQQRGDTFIYGAAVADANPATVTTSRSLIAVSVPSGFVVEALFRGSALLGSGSVNAIFTSPDETDQAASLPNCDLITNGSAQASSASFSRRTNTSAQIGARTSVASTSVYVGTYGFIWTRGRNS